MRIEVLKIKQGLDSGDECIICGGVMYKGEDEDILKCRICGRIIEVTYSSYLGWPVAMNSSVKVVKYKKSGYTTVKKGKFEDEFWAVIKKLSNDFRNGKAIKVNSIYEVRNSIRDRAKNLKRKEAEGINNQREVSKKLTNKKASYGTFGWDIVDKLW